MTGLDSPALYRLLSWTSPSYPVGAFAYSHGLESEVASGRVADCGALVEWIDTVLRQGTGTNRRGSVQGGLPRGARWRRAADRGHRRARPGRCSPAPNRRRIPVPGGRLPVGDPRRLAAKRAALGSGPGHLCNRCRAGLRRPRDTAHDWVGAYFHGFAASLVSAGVRLIGGVARLVENWRTGVNS